MLLPTTYALQPVSALIMLAGIYYGAQYGGSTTSILLNMPGRDVVRGDLPRRPPDGAQGPGRRGARRPPRWARSSPAPSPPSWSRRVAIPLSELALKFGPAEYFSLMVLGLIGAVVLAHGSLLKAIAMIVLGLLLGIVGTDVNSGAARFAFGVPELTDGLGVVSVAMGLFGFAEIISNLESTGKARARHEQGHGPVARPRRSSRSRGPRRCAAPALGSFLGLLPGGGAMLASFALLCARKEGREGSERVRQGRDPGRGRARSPPTTPARRRRSSRC